MIWWIALGLVLVLFAAATFRDKPVMTGVFAAIGLLLAVALSPYAATLILVPVACVLLGQPLFAVLGTMGAIALLGRLDGDASVDDVMIELELLVTKSLELADKEVLLAIPFFVLAGEIMTQGTLAKRLIDVARAAFGFLPGGLAIAGVMGCIFFAAISGSSPVTVIAIGSIMVPALRDAGYKDEFSVGLLTTSGSLGILIPPSIPMIVYAIMVGASTPIDPKDLFLAGLLPGAIIGGLLVCYAIFVGVRDNVPRVPFDMKALMAAMRAGIFSLCLPFLILIGIYTGLFTATEAAVVSVVYAAFVELVIHRDLALSDFPGIITKSMQMMGALFMIIALALSLNHVLVLEQIPDAMVEWVQSMNLGRTGFLIVVNIFLLGVGFVMDIMSAILILAPMLAPMANVLGIDPLHMGIIFIVNLEIGYCTPPIGLNLFVSSVLFKKDLGFVIRAVLRPLALMLVGLILVTWFPMFSSGAANAINGIEPPPAEAVVETQLNNEETANDVERKGDARSLKELMEAHQGGEAGTTKKPLSLKELMQQNSQADADAKPKKPLSLKELMEQNAAGAQAGSGDAQDTPKKPMSLKEIMDAQNTAP